MTELVELIYTSVTPESLSDADVKDILKTSHRNNPARNITGLLCYDGKRFLQILEGMPEDIHALYETIHKDDRHAAIELLHEGNIADRCFADWKMAYENVPDGMLAHLSETMAVVSLEEATDMVASPDNSFGARMFSIFMVSGLEVA